MIRITRVLQMRKTVYSESRKVEVLRTIVCRVSWTIEVRGDQRCLYIAGDYP